MRNFSQKSLLVRETGKKLSFFVLAAFFVLTASAIAWGQTTIAVQDFEAAPATPTLTYTTTGTGGSISTGQNPSTGAPASANLFAGGARGFQVVNGTTALTFTNQSLAGFTNNFIDFRLAGMSISGSNGIDGADTATLAISLDGGTTFSNEVIISGSAANRRYDFSATGASTTSYDGDNSPTVVLTPSGATGISTVRLDLPNTAAQVQVRITLFNNDADERWVIDDVRIRGTANPTVNLSVNSTAGSETGTTVITVTATASSAVTGNQTVNLGVSGTGITAGDFTLSNTTITILNGQTTGSVTFTVVDDAVVEGTETATLTISAPSAGITLGTTTTQNITITDNDIATTAPTITSANSATFTVGQAGTFTVTTTGTPTPTLSVSGALPAGVTFTNNGNGTATIAGTPAAGTNGSYPITITANNGTAPDATQNFTLTVNAAPPTSTTVIVSPANLNGFAFVQEVPNGTGSFVAGPATPPLGTGSAQFTVDDTGRLGLFTRQFRGTRLDAITELRYSAYRNSTMNPNVTISLQFDVDYDLTDTNTAFQGRLVFDPSNGANGITVAEGVFQQFDALAGRFFATGAIGIAAGCTQTTPCTKAELLALFPNIGIRLGPDPANSSNFLILRLGGPITGGLTANADALSITVNGANTTFDFEPVAVGPTAAGVSLSGRVTTESGRGIVRAVVTLTGGSLEGSVYAITDFDGNYSFSDIPAGETYVLSVSVKGYKFNQTDILVNLNEDYDKANFIGMPKQRIGTIR